MVPIKQLTKVIKKAGLHEKHVKVIEKIYAVRIVSRKKTVDQVG